MFCNSLLNLAHLCNRYFTLVERDKFKFRIFLKLCRCVMCCHNFCLVTSAIITVRNIRDSKFYLCCKLSTLLWYTIYFVFFLVITLLDFFSDIFRRRAHLVNQKRPLKDRAPVGSVNYITCSTSRWLPTKYV